MFSPSRIPCVWFTFNFEITKNGKSTEEPKCWKNTPEFATKMLIAHQEIQKMKFKIFDIDGNSHILKNLDFMGFLLPRLLLVGVYANGGSNPGNEPNN